MHNCKGAFQMKGFSQLFHYESDTSQLCHMIDYDSDSSYVAMYDNNLRRISEITNGGLIDSYYNEPLLKLRWNNRHVVKLSRTSISTKKIYHMSHMSEVNKPLSLLKQKINIEEKELDQKMKKTLPFLNHFGNQLNSYMSAISFTINKNMKQYVKNHFGIEKIFYVDHMKSLTRQSIYSWIATYNDAFKKRLDSERNIAGHSDVVITNSAFFIKFDSRTFGLVLIGNAYKETLSVFDKLQPDITSITDSTMYLYIFGRRTFSYIKSIETLINSCNYGLLLYSITSSPGYGNEGFRSTVRTVEPRELSTIFMESGVISSITNHIDKFINNKNVYGGKGIVYKTGILLYGQPGTGKTSLIRAMASLYHMDIVSIDMTKFDQIDIDELTLSINEDEDKNYIISLEDIDCVIADRENAEVDKQEKKVINKLLKFLDSTSSPNNVIFIATTNHIELLDKALLRSGRFDIKKEITGIYLGQTIAMCKSFGLSQSQIDKVLHVIKDDGIDLSKTPIQQAKLQTLILQQVEPELNLKGDDDYDE